MGVLTLGTIIMGVTKASLYSSIFYFSSDVRLYIYLIYNVPFNSIIFFFF